MAVAMAAWVAGMAGRAVAGDGLVEINQTCAVQTGCDSGIISDKPGFPILLAGGVARSYRLTSDLVVPDDVPAAIVVAAPRITIDLNGFSIVREGCVQASSASACRPASANEETAGIVAAEVVSGAGPVPDTEVRNGIVTGMPGHGVLLGRGARVSGLRARWNGGTGIAVGPGSEVTGCVAYENGGDGIGILDLLPGIGVPEDPDLRIPPASVVVRNAAFGNLRYGVFAPGNARIVENAVRDNGQGGILTSVSLVARNAVSDNAGHGIGRQGSTLVENAVYGNQGNGIEESSDFGRSCLVRGNSVHGNGGAGLTLGPRCAYRGNSVGGDNAGGTVLGGIDTGRNACGATAGCP